MTRLTPMFATLEGLRPIPYVTLLPIIEAGFITTDEAAILQTPRPPVRCVAVGRIANGVTTITAAPEFK